MIFTTQVTRQIAFYLRQLLNMTADVFATQKAKTFNKRKKKNV